MNRKDYSLLAGLLIVALLVRYLLFDIVAVWGDFGFYPYDARLILQGKTPFVDFLGRSPLFLYSYAGTVIATGEYVVTLRWFAIAWYILTAIPVYLIGRRLLDRRVAVVGAALYLLTPFSLAYGVRASTQSMALFFTVWGVYALLREDTLGWVAISGACIALGFLARQSMIAVAGGVGLWILYHDYTDGQPIKSIVGRLSAFSVAWIATVFIGYLLVVGGSVGMGIELFQRQVFGLIGTGGRGGLPLIGADLPAPKSSPNSNIPILSQIFSQHIGRVARVFASTIIAAAPVVGLLLFYTRDWGECVFTSRELQYLAGVLGVLAAYAIVMAFFAGFIHRTLTIVGFVGLTALVWTQAPLPRKRLYSKPAMLLLFVSVALVGGYLARDRLIANYYFLDFWPFVCLLAGLVGVLGWQSMQRNRRLVFGGALALLLVTSAAGAHPMSSTMLDRHEEDWFTMNNVDAYAEDINNRTNPGDPIFTAHPTYLSGSHARMPMDDPRIHWRYATYAYSSSIKWPAEAMYDHIRPRLSNGTYEYAILDTMTARIIHYGLSHGLLNGEFIENYCRVESADELYGQTDAELYRYQPAECPADQQVDWDHVKVVANKENVTTS